MKNKRNINNTNNITLFDVDSQIEKLERAVELLNQVKENSIGLKFLTVEDLMKATGFSRTTAQQLFRDPEFPSCNFGKTQVVELTAVIEYFSVPRRREYSDFWQAA